MAPFPNTSDTWEFFASKICEQILAAYPEGEMTLERALTLMRACSIGCPTNTRINLMGFTTQRLLSIRPAEWKGKHPTTPVWVRNSAVSLIEMLREQRPGEAFAPNALNDWTTRVLEDAIDWLVAVGLCEERISARTLYEWWKKAK